MFILPIDHYELSQINEDTHETFEDRIYTIIVEGKNTIDDYEKTIINMSHNISNNLRSYWWSSIYIYFFLEKKKHEN